MSEVTVESRWASTGAVLEESETLDETVFQALSDNEGAHDDIRVTVYVL